MKIAVLKETLPGERRVALVPASVPLLTKAGVEVWIESGAGEAAGFLDAQFAEKGAKIVTRGDAFAADCLLQIRSLGANPEAGRADLAAFHAGQIVIGMAEPLWNP